MSCSFCSHSLSPTSTQAFPDRTLTVMLFKNVTNASEIHAGLLDRSLEPEMSLLDPSPTVSLFALHVAAHKVCLDSARGSLTTRTIHSEIVYNLSANKHITEGLRRFGMAETASSVLACRFDASSSDVEKMKATIKGDVVDAADLESELAELTDHAIVKKYYKSGELECSKAVGSVEDAVVQRIGTRDVL
jgi:EKC/KEOPS complex subunit CGI121/TPRKB